MKHAYKNIRGLVFANPLILSEIKDKKLLKIAESYLPYDTGIEIECFLKQKQYISLLEEAIKNKIPYLKHISIDSEEQRYRIPSGIKGLMCLYWLSKALYEYSELNTLSGIHYHVDFTKVFDSYKGVSMPDVHNTIIDKLTKQKWVLDELDTWGYIGKYNAKKISSKKDGWIRVCNSYKTLEYRIGEMTFDYDLLMKRIAHVQSITKRLAIILMNPKKDETKPKKKVEKEGVIPQPAIRQQPVSEDSVGSNGIPYIRLSDGTTLCQVSSNSTTAGYMYVGTNGQVYTSMG